MERWEEIAKVRKEVARHLRVRSGSRVLDVLVGEGDLAREIAKSSRGTQVTAGEILDADIKEAKRRVEKEKLKDAVEILKMGITFMPFMDDSFDYVVNFIGWEDFTAISGEELIDKAFSEITRVLKTNGTLAITFIPALEPANNVSRKDRELQEYMWKSRKRRRFFREKFFLRMFERHGVKLIERRDFKTPKSRLNPQDAKEFLKWACENYKHFYAPDAEIRSFEEIIRKFLGFIEKHGMREYRSKFLLLIGKKTL